MDKNSKVNSGQEEQKKNNVENQPEKELNYEGNSEETSESKEDKIEEQKESTWEDKFNEMNDRYIRLYAEFDNFRRRTQKERIELMATASAGILKELIPVLDDFERAIVVNETASEIDSVKEGFSLIYNKYKGILESKGLKPMISKGEVFDSELHEAIANIPTESDEMKGKIIDDVEKGYLLHDKVVRFAKVVVGQ
ncbi:MAG: nucleotide exchange factor GrpE [Bacteroidota bacterium]